MTLLSSRSSLTTRTAAASNDLNQQEHQEISTIPQLREFILHPSVKANTLEQVRNDQREMRGIKLVFPCLGLKIAAAYDDVVSMEPNSDSVDEAPRRHRLRASIMSYAPSLSVEVQRFIVGIFMNDTSRGKKTNISYLSELNTFWGLLEKELAEDVSSSSSSGFPLTPPLVNPEDSRGSLLENKNLKACFDPCFLSLRKRSTGVSAAQSIILEALGLGISWGEKGMFDIVEKQNIAGEYREGSSTVQNEGNWGPAKATPRDSSGGDAGSTPTGAVAAAPHTTASPPPLSDRGGEETQAKRRRVVQGGIDALPLPLQHFFRILVDHDGPWMCYRYNRVCSRKGYVVLLSRTNT